MDLISLHREELRFRMTLQLQDTGLYVGCDGLTSRSRDVLWLEDIDHKGLTKSVIHARLVVIAPWLAKVDESILMIVSAAQ